MLSDGQILIWCVALIALEVQHLKWIVWEHWDCRHHAVKHAKCGCQSRLFLYL
jgi:hypothetical protein